MNRIVWSLTLLLLLLSGPLRADSVEHINSESVRVLGLLQDEVPGADGMIRAAAGVLVFPDVVKLGFGVGGQYGEGVLLVAGEPEGYYATAGASFGLQLGAVRKSEVILFMTDEALQQFSGSRGWQVGIDGNVTVVKHSAGAHLDSREAQDPVVAFILSDEGLMADLSLEGAKITRLAR
ncbi:hypothetical protein EY643_02230 [Halioglobus maricola]|uniref:Ysc84 actin-binding domain-containing protein n=1 Tax=Halioglobus maricola TaxID=2601894 RepID=A0A5P9NFL9_9GAMM|nr:YSC84-related protein [Halioglobus maricola]QFU74561.1 hypothetical protein EY643_02230 [Halioglobus maricola]